MNVLFKFLLALLATWRVTHLLAKEDGPGDLIVRIRRRLGQSFWGKLMDCFKCLSLWIAIPFAFFVGGTWVEKGMIWLALSGSAILLENLIREPFIIEERKNDELLRRPTPVDDQPDRGSVLEGKGDSR
ncbi:hypothetical protein L0337_19495 [candidate division KSB1 bacterium]|nr:hypothetical protein [candidate division KSB1 bacterium]